MDFIENDIHLTATRKQRKNRFSINPVQLNLVCFVFLTDNEEKGSWHVP
jgi:hypothetical protein